jgi:hypothetical protein
MLDNVRLKIQLQRVIDDPASTAVERSEAQLALVEMNVTDQPKPQLSSRRRVRDANAPTSQEDIDGDIECWFRHDTRDGLTSSDHIEIFRSLELSTQSIIDAIAAPMLALYNEGDIALLIQTYRQTQSEFVRGKVLGAITAISKYSTISTARQHATDFLNQLDQPTPEPHED